jgi:cytochrome P450
MTSIIFDPLDPGAYADRQDIFERLRNDAPVHTVDVGGQRIHLLSRHDDVAKIISDPTTVMNRPGQNTPAAYGEGPAADLWRNAVSMMDPPRHACARRAISGPFTHRHVEQFRVKVNDIVINVFSDADFRNTDVVRDIAVQIPMHVICELLGIPTEDWPNLQSWTDDFLRIFLPDASAPETVERTQKASQNFIDYFGDMIDQRRQTPRDDLTSEFAASINTEGGIGKAGLIGALRGLLTAGFETTAATISAGFYAFAQQPEQFGMLRDQPELIPGAVEELLRWETPVQVISRYLGKDTQIHDTLLPAGEQIWLLTGAANHDPRNYDEPSLVNVERNVRDHFSFGGGRHFCLGAYLARLELQIVLQQLVTQCASVELLCDDVPRRDNLQFPSIESLPAVLHKTV